MNDFRVNPDDPDGPRLTGAETLALLGGKKAIDQSVYKLADCERYVDEMRYRQKTNMPLSLPLTHCQFNLADTKSMLKGTQIKRHPYRAINARLRPVDRILKRIAERLNEDGMIPDSRKGKRARLLTKVELYAAEKLLKATRNWIARTPELP
jgi:hypothetical protein